MEDLHILTQAINCPAELGFSQIWQRRKARLKEMK
jgi:hypothetical protein